MRTEDWLTLAVLYQEKSLSRASKELYISQPALTIRLQKIEKELGCQIAVRSNRGLLFTPEGEYLIAQSHKIVNLINETISHALMLSEKDVGTIKMVAPSSIAKFYLPQLFIKYKENFPSTDFDLTVLSSSEAEKALLEGKAYCGFMHGDCSKTLASVKLATMPAYAVSSTPMTLEALKDAPIILHNTSKQTQDRISTWWTNTFHSPMNVRMEVKHLDICLSMVEGGFGAAIVFGEFFKNYPSLHALPLYNQDSSPLVRDLWFIYAKELFASSRSMTSLLQFIRSNSALLTEPQNANYSK